MKGVESHSDKDMKNTYLDHPTEETLERFLLSQSSDEESETVETHFMACSACVSRLENLETQIVVLKTALGAFEVERKEKEAARAARYSAWRSWFTVPKLSFAGAGAFAALAVGTFVLPQLAIQDVSLAPNRGTEVQIAPEHRPLRLHLLAPNANDGPASVELVGIDGTLLWSGKARVDNHQVDVRVPEIRQAGSHFVRLSKQDSSGEEVVQEYSLDVK